MCAGWLLFGGFVATVYSVSGLAVSFIGSGWYSYIKLTEKRPLPQAAAMVVQTDGEGTHRVDEELPASLKTSPVDAVGIRKRSPQ